MIAAAEAELEPARATLLVDAHVSSCGDDLHRIMTREQGPDSPAIHQLARDVFQRTTAVARRLGLYGAGQDLLSDAFSRNLRGMGPGYAELEFEPRPSPSRYVIQRVTSRTLDEVAAVTSTQRAVAKRLMDRWTPIPDAPPIALPH